MDWLLSLVPLTTGFGMYYIYNFDKPLYNETMGKFFDFVINKCSEKASLGFNKEKKLVK